MWLDGDDEDTNGTKDEPMGGPEAGDYTHADPVPGEPQSGLPSNRDL
ncbi:hypothetical protein K8942_04485 [Candidatus Peribacteria bacterium]|nr:MAG: hypothetical protein K8942_04485 [Candidatus Peribacteria bacterium]